MSDNKWKKIKEDLRKEIIKLRAIGYTIDSIAEDINDPLIILAAEARDLVNLKRLLKGHKTLEEMSLTALRIKARNMGVNYYTKLTRQTLIYEIKEILKTKAKKEMPNEQTYNFQDFDGIEFQPK